MTQICRLRKPLVLLPQGPYAWNSHRDILPPLVAVWKGLGFDILPTWFPNPGWSYTELEKLSQAKVLIFALGHAQYDGWSTLRSLRSTFGIRTPVRIMYTTDIYNRMRIIAEEEDILTADDVIVVNSSSEARLLKTFFPQLKTQVETIPLPVDRAVFNPTPRKSKAALRRELNLPLDQKIILYAGRISTQKNVVTLLGVFRELRETMPSSTLLIVGPVDDIGVPHFVEKKPLRCAVEINDAVTALDLTRHVEVRPAVTQSGLSDLFHACDVNVSLSVHSGEDFGYGVAQGLACGIPTVVTRWGGGVDLARHCFGVNVGVSVHGPMVDQWGAIESLKQALAQPRGLRLGYGKSLGSSTISSSWKKVCRSYRGAGASKFVRSCAPKKVGVFKNGLEKDFKKFVVAYSGGRDLTTRRFYLAPVLVHQNSGLKSLLWTVELSKMSQNDRLALMTFIESQPRSRYFRKIPRLSRAGKSLLLMKGLMCPEIGIS